MPTPAGIAAACAVLTAAGMLPAMPAADSAERVKAWGALIDATASDQTLEAAVKAVASSTVYGQVKPSDVNQAIRDIRSERVIAWLRRHSVPVEGRGGFDQAVYARGFLRAIGDGADTVTADQAARGALAQARQVAASEPDTPLPEILGRIDAALRSGQVPWASSLPPARPLAQIDAAPRKTAAGRAEARAVLDRLGRNMPKSSRKGA